MSDYTIQELQEMLNDKIQEEVGNELEDPIQKFMDSMDDASDFESEKIQGASLSSEHLTILLLMRILLQILALLDPNQ